MTTGCHRIYSPSHLFRKALAYVEPYADRVYILSARYGLVALDQRLEPYEQTVKSLDAAERAAWAQQSSPGSSSSPKRSSPPPAAAAAQERAGGFAQVLARIEAHAGEPFHQIRGGEFRYQVSGRSLRLDRTNQSIPYGHLEEACGTVPLRSTSEVQHLRAPSIIYAIARMVVG